MCDGREKSRLGDGEWVCFVRGVGVGIGVGVGADCFNLLQRPGQDLRYNHPIYYSYHLQYTTKQPFTQTQSLFNTNSLPTNTSCTPISSTFDLQLQRLLRLRLSSLIIILPQPYLHLEFVNPDFRTPYGITFNLSVVILISMLLSHHPPPQHHHRLSLPFPTLTPIPMLPTPNEFDTYTQPDDEKEEELPLCPELVNQLLRGPVLQTDCPLFV